MPTASAWRRPPVKVAVSASAAKPTKRWESDGGNLIIRFHDAQKPVLDLICGFPDAYFVIFLTKNLENSRKIGCFGGFSGINHLRKTRGLLLQFNQFPWKCADSDGNCRQLSTGVTHPLLPLQAITGTVWWENDWHFLSFTCASFRRLTCRTYFSGKKRTVKQWNRHQNEAYRNGMILGCRSVPRKLFWMKVSKNINNLIRSFSRVPKKKTQKSWCGLQSKPGTVQRHVGELWPIMTY